MSDTDFDSDDDLLASGPSFASVGKRSRKSQANELKMIDYLDECLEQTNETHDRRDRIADMIKKENEDEDAEDKFDADAEKGAEDVDGNAAATAPRVKEESVDTDNNRNKEEEKGVAADAYNLEDDVLRNGFDIDDPSYWERIDNAAAVGGGVGAGAGDKGGKNASTRAAIAGAKRRREIDDEVDGIGVLSDDDDDDDGGKGTEWTGDGNSGDDGNADSDISSSERKDAQRKRRAAMASARVTGLSTSLGVRQTLFGRQSCNDQAKGKNCNEVRSIVAPLYESDEEAIFALHKILHAAKKQPNARRKNTIELQQKKQKHLELCKLLIDPILSALDVDLLLLMLQNGTIAQICSANNIAMLPEIRYWLWRVACSGDSVGVDMADGAVITLLQIMDGSESNQKNAPANKSADEQSYKDCRINVRYMLDALVNHFGLSMDDGPAPAIPPQNNENNGSDNEKKRSKCDIIGLNNFMKLWHAAFENGSVAWVDDDKDSMKGPKRQKTSFSVAQQASQTALGLASKCCVGLIKIGLDPSSQSGHGLMETLGSLMVSVFESVSRNFFGGDNTQLSNQEKAIMTSPFLTWIEATADLVLLTCSKLSAGLPGAADEDDTEGWLPLSLAVRIIPVSKTSDTEILGGLAHLKAILAEKSIQLSLGRPNNWENQVDDALKNCPNENDKDSPGDDSFKLSVLRWRAIAAAEVGLASIADLGDQITRNGPLFLSLVELAGLCANASIALFAADFTLHSSQSDEEEEGFSNGAVYGGIENARIICQFFERLETLCAQLKKKVTCVFIYPHLRRVKELLAMLAGHFRQCKAVSERAKSNTTQKSIDGYFLNRENFESQEDRPIDKIA